MLDGRNGESPIKGIDTSTISMYLLLIIHFVEMERARLRALTLFYRNCIRIRFRIRRNGESPIKGIDTLFICVFSVPYQDCVEMERARLRALTQHYKHNTPPTISFRRNGESPIKGIDTTLRFPFSSTSTIS